jgi:hypothetical protein
VERLTASQTGLPGPEQLLLHRNYCEHRGDLCLFYGLQTFGRNRRVRNTPVCFEVLPYAGVRTIAVIIDPDHGLDLDKLIVGLQNEFDPATC